MSNHDGAASGCTLDSVVSFDDWESGKARLDQDEIFDPVWGEWILGYTLDDEAEELKEYRNLVGFKGRDSGIMLGPWFENVMER